jgi:hypothetical protein
VRKPGFSIRINVLTALMWSLGFLLVLVLAPAMVSGDSDLVLHILYGRTLLDSGFPASDPYLSGVTPAPILQEWGFELLVAMLDNGTGLSGPLLIFAMLTGCLVAGLYRRMRSQGVCLWLAVLYTLVLLFTLRTHLVIRPHLVSWVAVAMLMVLLTNWHSGKTAYRAALVRGSLLMLLWCNLHGGFLIGLVVMAVFLVAELLAGIRYRSSRRAGEALLMLGLFAGVTLLNPWGWELHRHLAGFLTNNFITGATSDFQPPSFTERTLPALLIALLLVWPPLLARRRETPLYQWLLAIGLTVYGFTSARNIPFLGIVMLPIAALPAQRWLEDSTLRFSRGVLASARRLETDDSGSNGLVLLSVTLLVAVLPIAGGLVRIGLNGPGVPTAALDWVRDQTELHQQPVFADYLAAGFLLYDTPVSRVHLHSLNANYPPARLETWVRVASQTPGWEQDLEDLPWAFLLSGSAQAVALQRSDCWRELYRDEQAVVFENRCQVF